MSSQDELNALLREGIELARNGQRDQAREIFEQVIQEDDLNELAWMWMATVLERDSLRREALEIVLEINPNNTEAREALNRLGGPRAARKAKAAQEISDRIGGDKIEEVDFQPVAERPPEPPAPEPEPEPTPEEREAQLAHKLIEVARTEEVPAGPLDEEEEAAAAPAAAPASTEPEQVVEYIDFAALDRRRRMQRLGRWTGWLAVVLAGAGLVAILLLGLAQLATPPLPTPTATPGLQTALAALISPTPTISPTPQGIIVVTRETREAAVLPPTWTPSATPSPTVTYTPSPTPLAPAAYGLIFSRRAEGAERYSLYTIRGDGTQLQRLTGDQTDDRGPAPASDGRRLVFVSDQRGGRELVLAMLDALTTPIPTAVPSPTPETEQPTAEITPEAESGASLPASVYQPITALGGRRTSAPSWSSDGFRIAFSAEVDGDEEIFIVNVDGSGFAQLTDNSDIADRDPAWSPNGEWIVFASDRAGVGEFELYRVHPNGSELTRLTDTAGSSFEPAWSPDSASIAFVSDRDRDADLYIMNADGSNEVLLTRDDGGAEDRYPAWSPDGRWIAFSSNRESANFQLYLIDPTGERLARFTDGSGDDVDPAWLR